MENVVTINNTKQNILEFDITVEGLDKKDVEANFIIRAKEMDLSFAAKKEKGDTWSVTIPKLPMVEKTTYKCSVVVVADGYYFEPMKGSINVVGSHEVYTTEPQNVTLKSTDSTTPKKKVPAKKKTTETAPVPGSVRTKFREKSVEQLAQELMEQRKTEVKKTVKPDTSTIDKVINKVKEDTAKKLEPIVEKKAEPVVEKKVEPVVEKKVATTPPDSKNDAVKKIIEEAGKNPSKPVVRKVVAVPPLKESKDKSASVVTEDELDPVDEKLKKVEEVLESVGIQSLSKKRKSKSKFSLGIRQ